MMTKTSVVGGISAIIPVYNRESFIAETLMSIERQTILPREVIVVDDNSSDDSVIRVKEYANRSRLNIKVITNKRKKGQSGATNYGIENSTGEFIALLDSDDLWTPNHLEQLIRNFKKYPKSKVAFSAVEFFGNEKDARRASECFIKSVYKCLKRAFEQREDGVWISNRHLLDTLLDSGFYFRCPASLINKELFIKYGLLFDEDISYTLDAQFMILAAYYASFIYVDNVGLRIRRHAENDVNISYGEKIYESYDNRAIKLKRFFCNKKLCSSSKKALKACLLELQEDVILHRTNGKDISIFIKESMHFIRRIPCLDSLGIVVKLILKNILPVNIITILKKHKLKIQ